tara:strand:+ start:7325 stop:8320 length:996 start_codon:yes stop_codon:yes gene_type:complete
MKQSFLDNWLSLDDQSKKIKNVMYLDWSEFIPKNVIWYEHIPSNINFKTTIHWKQPNIDIIVCGNIKEGKLFDKTEEMYSNFSFLKSHLQKCIRLGDINKSLKTALHMIKMNPNGFIRRLIIIMVEDVLLHESFGILMWLIASNITLMNRHVKWLLGVVYILCTIDTKDDYQISPHKIIPLNTLLHSRYHQLKEEQYSILYSIKLRESYGGLSCDIKLLNKVATCWYQRFLESDRKLNQLPIKPICENLPKLDIKDWYLTAIDYHCAKYIINMILQEYPELSEKKIKNLLWNYNSNINYRVTNPSNNQDWENIKKYVSKKQFYILHKYYNS